MFSLCGISEFALDLAQQNDDTTLVHGFPFGKFLLHGSWILKDQNLGNGSQLTFDPN